MKRLAGFIDGLQNSLVGLRLNLITLEQLADLRAISRCAGRILVGNEREFRIHRNQRTDMFGAVDGLKNGPHHGELISVSVDSLDPRRGLQWISRIDDEDPIAVAQQRQRLGNARLPISLRGLRNGGQSQTCEEECEQNEAMAQDEFPFLEVLVRLSVKASGRASVQRAANAEPARTSYEPVFIAITLPAASQAQNRVETRECGPRRCWTGY